MKISLNWISDFVDLSGVDLKALINKFTLSTAEVEEMYTVGDEVKGVIVAKVLTCVPHPQSDHLHICTVDTGKEILPCVCGAKKCERRYACCLCARWQSCCWSRNERSNYCGRKILWYVLQYGRTWACRKK